MKITETKLAGVLILEPKVYKDERGSFQELYQKQKYKEILSLENDFVQDNLSQSSRNILRGLHFQVTKPQGKLVSVLEGRVYDVAADINPDSKTYGQYVGVELSSDNNLQLYVPAGYAHGFCVLSESATFYYKCTDYYDASDEGGIAWNCPTLNIDWPITDPILSSKDQHYSGLKA